MLLPATGSPRSIRHQGRNQHTWQETPARRQLMKRIHRAVWNEITRSFVAVAETVRTRGKQSSSCCESGVAVSPSRQRGLLRPVARPLALEQRFMFDGAAVADAAHALPDAGALALIPDTPAPGKSGSVPNSAAIPIGTASSPDDFWI